MEKEIYFPIQRSFTSKIEYIVSKKLFKELSDSTASQMEKIRAIKDKEMEMIELVKDKGLASGNPEEIERLRREIKQLHDEVQKLKRGLPGLLPMSAYFISPTRRALDAIVRGIHMLDIDGQKNPRGWWQQKVDEYAAEGKDIYQELLILAVNVTASGHGLRIYGKCQPDLSIRDNMMLMYDKLNVPEELRDTSVSDPSRISYAVPMSEYIHWDDEFLTYCDNEYMRRWSPAMQKLRGEEDAEQPQTAPAAETTATQAASPATPMPEGKDEPLFGGKIPYSEFTAEYIKRNWGGKMPVVGERHSKAIEMAKDFATITDYDEKLLRRIMPDMNGLGEKELADCIRHAVSSKRAMPPIMKEVLQFVSNRHIDDEEVRTMMEEKEEELSQADIARVRRSDSVKASCDGVETGLWFCVLGAVSFIVGFLCTRVRLSIHGALSHLNSFHLFVGLACSGKGSLDPLYELWMTEEIEADDRMEEEEDRWLQNKRERINDTQQPKELYQKRRIFPFRTSVSMLLIRMKNIAGMHGISYTAEGSTLVKALKHDFSDVSELIRHAFDNSEFNQGYNNLNSMRGKIKKVMWNLGLCMTPDVLQRFFPNVVDGTRERAAIFVTPDNTFSKLRILPPRSQKSKECILRTAHLLPFFQGDVTLSRLQKKCEEWIENMRIAAAKENDVVKARMRLRVPKIAMRITVELMLVELADWLYRNINCKKNPAAWTDGCKTAEEYLKTHPDAAARLLPRFEKHYLDTFDVLSDYLISNQLHYFESRIKKAYSNSESGTTARSSYRKNSTIYDRLPDLFDYNDLRMVAQEGQEVPPTDNALKQMRKNWAKAGLIATEKVDGKYKKIITG